MSGYVSGVASSIWSKRKVGVAALSTNVIDTTDFDTIRGIKYILCFYSDIEDKTKMLDMSIIKENTSIKDTVYGRIGIGLNLAVTAVKNGSSIELRLQNNETFQVTADIAKLTFKP